MDKNSFTRDIINRATIARDNAASAQSSPSKYINHRKSIPNLFLEGEIADVRLIILGQDPTTGGKSTTTVLDLDKPNSLLSKFCQRICSGLGFNLSKEVYATNLCKWFFTERPTQIKKIDDVDVLSLTRSYWLPVLLDEIRRFNQGAIVATLGEPVLNSVTISLSKGLYPGLRGYWGHVENWTHISSFDPSPSFGIVRGEDNIFKLTILPMPHLNSVKDGKWSFYGVTIDAYLAWARSRVVKNVA